MFNPLKERKLGSRIGVVILEVFSVVLAVVLALAANDWRESRATKDLTRISVEAIAEELGANLEAVGQAHEYHGKVLEQIRTSLPQNVTPTEEEAQSLYLELYKSGIFRRATVVDAAWVTAQSSGATNGLDFGLALSLSKTYTFQSDYLGMSRSARNAAELALYLGASPVHYLFGTYESLNGYWWQEEALIGAYQEALQTIEQSGFVDIR